MYAGSCYFGNQWSGVAQAAQGYFGKPTRELTRAECVVLAKPAQRALGLRRQRGAGPQARTCGGGADGARQKLTHTQALELRDEVSALPLW